MVSAAQPAVREAVARRRESDEPAPALTRHYATVAKLHTPSPALASCRLPNLLPKDQLPPSLLSLFARRACFLPVPDPAPPETPPASWDHPADHWPPEQDRQLVLRLCSEVPLHSDTITAALRLGIDRLVQPTFEALNLASTWCSVPPLRWSRPTAVRLRPGPTLLRACSMPASISSRTIGCWLAAPRSPPPRLIGLHRWRWSFWAAFNPDTLGRLVWDRYPTVRCLLEMVMTCMYEFPCQSLLLREGLSADAVRMRELRALLKLRKLALLEMQLAGTDITEASSRLLGWLMDCAPCGPARQPPAWAIDQLRKLNAQYGIGLRLCAGPEIPTSCWILYSRASASQQWLVHLVDNLGNQSLSILPVQCLAEILLAHVGQSTDRRQQLLYRLASLANSAADASEEVLTDVRQLLSYFMIRLRAKSATIRATAADCLALILAPQGADVIGRQTARSTGCWTGLPRLPAARLLAFLAGQLVDCIAQETCPRALGAYIAFLTRHLLESRLANIDRLAWPYRSNNPGPRSERRRVCYRAAHGSGTVVTALGALILHCLWPSLLEDKGCV
uniref:Non-specific serine/threonine protein kinase n=1 Tax=Macrostomum lignano TaxID=282301 RepID=A0A1I8FU26_9PLAT